MGNPPLNLRIFLSSPGDVADERQVARDVIHSLGASHLLRGKVGLEIVCWDDPDARSAMDARDSPQASVNRYTGRPAECDLTLVILWGRLGTPLPPNMVRPDGSRFPSGTVWEYEDAIAANKPVFVYRRSAKPQTDLDDPEFDSKRSQFDAVKRFFGGFINHDGSLRAGFTTYFGPEELEGLLKQHLEAFVNDRLTGQAVATLPAVSQDDPRVTQVLTLVDELARKNRELDARDSEIQRLSQENADLRRAAVARTLTAAEQPNAEPEATGAARALLEGRTGPAEQFLADEERALATRIQQGGGDEATLRREAAARAREQGALAVGQDVQAALNAFRRAADYDPSDTWTLFSLGDAQVAVGDLDAALFSYAKGRRVAEGRIRAEPDDLTAQRDLSVSHNKVGDVLVAQGDGPGALASYRKGLVIAEALAARDPANNEWQRDLSVSHEKVGDVLVAQGDGPGALTAYRTSLAIREVLAARDPANTEWQRDLSVSHNKVGDVLVAQGDGPGALGAYRTGLAIREALAARDPADTQWQRDLSVSHDRVGDVLVAQGDGPGGLTAYRTGLKIREALAARDPANTRWQRDLSVSHNKVGDVLAAQGDGPGALTAYRKDSAIAEALAARDPANTEWQRDLSISHDRVGDELLAQGDRPDALTAFRTSLAIREVLAARDPANTEWQRDLSVSHNKVGDVLVAQGDRPGALTAFRTSLAIREALAARDPANTEWQRDLSVSHNKVGNVLVALHDRPGGLTAYRKGLLISEALAALDPTNAQWQVDLAVSCSMVGSVADGQSAQTRRGYFLRGRAILLALKSEARLAPAQDGTGWFDAELRRLGHDEASGTTAVNDKH